jgi:hypothetical protein
MADGDDPKPGNGRGRPRLEADERAVSVSVSISPRQYETLCRHARRRNLSASGMLRWMISGFPGFRQDPE